MRILILTFILAIFVQFGQAQTSDVVSIGADYVNDIYYNLETGNETSAERAEWDIAFNVTYLGSSILSNGGNGLELLLYPHGNHEDWNDMDLTDIEDWEVQQNSDTSWVRGAFDLGAEGFNIGWGTYNPVTHAVIGDLLFVLKYPDETYKKIWIVDLIDEIYTYKIADLDGSNEEERTIVKANYTSKNFAYVSLQDDGTIDREPTNTDWDLLFTKYPTFIEAIGSYNVTGVISNIGVKVLQVNDTPTDDASYVGGNFKTNISEIGYDWKEFTGEFVIAENLTYFVEAKDGNIWKVIFTGFGGSANGNFEFTKELVGAVGIDEISSITNLGMFPNPSTGLVNLAYHNVASQSLHVTVYDITGKMVHSAENITPQIGLNQSVIDLSSLEKGIYIVQLNNGIDSIQQKLIIE